VDGEVTEGLWLPVGEFSGEMEGWKERQEKWERGRVVDPGFPEGV